MTGLIDSIYEHINDDYGYGKIGTIKVVIRRKDGWINGSKLASLKKKKNGDSVPKALHKYKEMDRTQEIIRELSEQTDSIFIEITKTDLANQDISRDNMNIIQGTYVPLLIAKDIITWINPNFYYGISNNIQTKIKPQFVYIISCDDYIKKNLYKIGYTNNIKNRLYALQAGNPFLKVIHYVNGSSTTERKIHIEYESSRFDREWFKIEDIDKCIEKLNQIADVV